MMKRIFKRLYYETNIGYQLLYYPKCFYDYIHYQMLSDKTYIKKKFKKNFQRELNLSSPVTFTEKLQWLKLYDRRELYTQCADKLAVRQYIKDKIGEKYLIPLLFNTKDPQNINISTLPNIPLIIKTTHDSGGTIVIKDKNNVNFSKLQRYLKRRLDINYFYSLREWEYKNIIPSIVVEELLSDDSGNDVLNDYKVHCFNGHPLYIQTIFDRKTEVKEDWYDTHWNLIDAYYFSERKKHVPKPDLLDELLNVSTKLSEDFPYVRVDLYTSQNRVYFGELTFRPYGGLMKFKPEAFDMILGEQLQLPSIIKD